MSFSLYYAPPEVIIAYKEKRRTILADPSADVWALGVRRPTPALHHLRSVSHRSCLLSA